MRLQRMMASRIVEEQDMDNKIKLMNIINELVTGPKQHVQKEAVLVEADLQGLPERETLRLLEELKKDNFIIEKDGYIKKI